MIVGIGVDMIAIERFTRPFSPRFFSRVFTEGEQAYMKGKPLQTMAGIFAAKEAVVKALGTGFSGFWPNAVEIVHDEKGKPLVKLHGVLTSSHNEMKLHVSISHTETDAVAFAVCEKESTERIS